MANNYHRLPLSDEELAAAEQQQARVRNVERARLERERIEASLNRGVDQRVLRAAEGEESLGGQLDAAGREAAADFVEDLKHRSDQVLRNYAASNAGTGAPFEEREFAAPRPRPKPMPPPPKPQPRVRARKTVPVDDWDEAATVRALIHEIVPAGTKPDAATKELIKMCEVWAAQANSNPIKANRDFAIALRRNMPLFILSPQIEIGKLTALVNAVIKIDESLPVKDSSAGDEELMAHVRRIQHMIDTMPDDEVHYRAGRMADDEEEGE